MTRTTLLSIIILCLTKFCFGANRFVESGVPSPTREWYGQEYTHTAELLTAGGVALPTYDGADGEKIFLRMISVENFSLARDLSLPLDRRMGDAIAMQQAANAMMKKYAAEATRGAKLNREMAELLAFSLRMCTVMFTLVDEFLPTIKHDDKYQIRIDGLRKMKMGMEGLFAAAEQTLGEKDFYTDADIRVLLRAMGETIPAFNREFSSDFRVELRGRLKKRVPEFQSPDEKKILELMQTELKAQSAKPALPPTSTDKSS